jgi:DNA-binding transcriptional MerR regulator
MRFEASSTLLTMDILFFEFPENRYYIFFPKSFNIKRVLLRLRYIRMPISNCRKIVDTANNFLKLRS